ncbi:MAG TPA: zincin-like metallopeptidase domain-containing protein [Rhizomicrobium sp.]|jgi:antirestriction protein ArdC
MHGSHPTQTLYERITSKIMEAMNNGAGTFKMPWHAPIAATAFPVNASTHAPYRGINILSLWVDALTQEYPSGYWASYRQWQHLGAQVRKGERGSLIVFYKRAEPQTDADENSDERSGRPIFTASHVFNAAQVEGWIPDDAPHEPRFEPHEQVEAFVQAVGARVEQGHAMARYRLDMDCIEMPSPLWFTGTSSSTSLQSYYAVLLHELTHWSGASHRLDREFGKRFGDEAYAMEELVAELGAAFMCSAFGLANDPRPDHAQYLASWLKVLGSDPKAIFAASSRAQEATQFLFGLAEGGHH